MDSDDLKKTSDDDVGLIPTYFPTWGEDEINALADVLEDGPLCNGPKLHEFELEFAKYVGAQYCVVFPSHTVAMHCALFLIREQISSQKLRMPSFGGWRAYNAALLSLLKPVLCEVGENGSLALRDNEAGVVYHHNGRLGKPSMVEDCADIPNHHTLNRISVYDFSVDSHITLCGNGGAVCCDDENTYNMLLRFKHMGKNPLIETERFSDDNIMWGMDYPVNEVSAAFGLIQLKKLDKKLQRIAEMHDIVKTTLGDSVEYLDGPPTRMLDILVPDARKMQLELLKHNIMTDLFPRPLHLQAYSAYTGRLDNIFTISDDLYRRGLYLPSMTDMSNEDLIAILEKVTTVLNDTKEE